MQLKKKSFFFFSVTIKHHFSRVTQQDICYISIVVKGILNSLFASIFLGRKLVIKKKERKKKTF